MAEPSALGRQRVPKRGDADRHIVIGKTPMMPMRFANDEKTKSVPTPPPRFRREPPPLPLRFGCSVVVAQAGADSGAVADADVRMVWHLLKMGINPDQKRTKRVNSSTGELEEEDSRQPTTPLRYVLFRESDNFLTRGAYQLLLLPVANGPVRSKAEQSDFMRGLEG